MKKHFIFVYGSLRAGNAGAMPIRFPDTRFVAVARARGSLYDLGEYPGLLLNESSSMVTGEVYEVDEKTLGLLDKFELSSDYQRKQVEVDTGAQTIRCWVYVPEAGAKFFSGRTLIKSGDWIEHVKLRTDRQK